MNYKTYQWISLILGSIIFLGIIFLAYIIFNNLDLIKSNPCVLCMKQSGISCVKLNLTGP